MNPTGIDIYLQKSTEPSGRSLRCQTSKEQVRHDNCDITKKIKLIFFFQRESVWC